MKIPFRSIIFCLKFQDETGNNPEDFIPAYDADEKPELDKFFTNVVKLHVLAGGALNDEINESINNARTDGQVCLYERGIGGEVITINGIKGIIGGIKKKLEFATGNLSEETKPMLEKLEKVYEKGDKLYLIGFSRGSASARNFAMGLYNNGLKTKDGVKVEQPPIEFLGCFDTVSMRVGKRIVGILSDEIKKQFTKSTVLGEEGRIAPNVKNAVHNLSLDDGRQFIKGEAFPPVLMGAEDRVHEAWFSGTHGDIGGNYYKRGLSDGSCEYMKEWIESLDGGIVLSSLRLRISKMNA